MDSIGYNKLSMVYNIFHVDWGKPITYFEGYLDTKFCKNAISGTGLNTDISFLLNDDGSIAGNITTTYAGSGVLGFAAMDGLNDVDDAYVRVTFDGATGSTGNNRIDNIQFNATEMPVMAMSVPEPGCPMLIGVGAAVALSMRSRRSS